MCDACVTTRVLSLINAGMRPNGHVKASERTVAEVACPGVAYLLAATMIHEVEDTY